LILFSTLTLTQTSMIVKFGWITAGW